MLLKDKTAVVTGCNKGIGKKILEVFSANGATVFACVRNIDEQFESFINELKKKFNNQIIPIQFDLNDEKKIKDAAENILKTNKHIDILIYNFDNNKFSKKFNSSIINNDIKTSSGGLSDFLNDGSIFIEEQNFGRLLIINKNGKLEWEYINKSKNNNVFQTTWSRIIKDESFIKILKNQIKNKKCQN